MPEPLKAAALIPTYNNAGTLRDVVERTLKVIPDVLVVDDGSTDETSEVLASFGPRIRLHRHPQNQGKGRALRNGFRLLADAGFTLAIALDSDGQHFPEDLPRFLEAARATPNAIIIGDRGMDKAGAPRKSLFGLWFSNRAIRRLTGVALKDSQCGFRAYPLALVAPLDLRGNRYDLELEVLIRAARAGAGLLQVPVQITYTPPGGRVSHFRPVRDFLQIAGRLARILLKQGR